MSAPRDIRGKDAAVLRHIQRTTRIFSIFTGASSGWPRPVLGGGVLGKWYMTASMTLFIVAIVLLVIIDRDLRAAVRVLANETPEDDAKVQNGRIAALSSIMALIWLVILC